MYIDRLEYRDSARETSRRERKETHLNRSTFHLLQSTILLLVSTGVKCEGDNWIYQKQRKRYIHHAAFFDNDMSALYGWHGSDAI